jgi:hypothetical protein
MFTVMPRISQNVKQRADQDDYFTWEATLTIKINSPMVPF